ncbi:MAG TPA: molecular chaperone TorD family protein [Syntrophomonas sp.]|nr:molecular chaperone TorD family protein [Syntrophomonas sp.]
MLKQQQYELLALALSYPNPDLLKAIQAGDFEQAFGQNAPIPASLEELEVEYCRMFVGPGHIEVPPYESVYRGHDHNMQKGTIMGPATVDVREMYARSGLQLAANFTDMPDHIAVETWFLAYLEAMASTDPQGNYIEYKKQFLDQHLGQWVEPFVEGIQRRGRHPWYEFAANLLYETIQSELS